MERLGYNSSSDGRDHVGKLGVQMIMQTLEDVNATEVGGYLHGRMSKDV